MGAWVDEILLCGSDNDSCLNFGGQLTLGDLRREVAQRQSALEALGIKAGGSVALRLPPSLAYLANLLATWRIGAQASLLDHRLTEHEIGLALARLKPQAVVSYEGSLPGGLRAFYDVKDLPAPHPGEPAATDHCVVQLSSGSTGPSKVIGRTSESLIEEIERYKQIDGVPLPGERVVLLASVVHVLGLVGGLLYCLNRGTELVLPTRLTVDAILQAVASGDAPATLLGVPFHIELLASAERPPRLPQLKRMTTGGELIRAEVWERFAQRYGVPLGNMYGMTEVGVIATDLFGQYRPSLMPAPGLEVRSDGGELVIRMPRSPYIGLSDPARWRGGWLRTKDAGTVDPQTGLLTVKGRLDSQVSVGGLKVDLTEVEHVLAALPSVEAAVVVFDNGIEAYVVSSASPGQLDSELALKLAPYKRPREVHVVEQLPRTATGKLVRAQTVLRSSK